GAMVGVGWLILIDDWLSRGGPGGAMLGFFLGGLALVPVAFVYGRFVQQIPGAASELAYTSTVFPRAGFITAWMMTLAYLIVCPWEAVAIGKLISYLVPSVKTFELYKVGQFSVYLPALILGIMLTVVIILLNYRGIRLSSRFINYTTFILLSLFTIFTIFGLLKLDVENLKPFFAQKSSNMFMGALISTIMVLQIVPYFLTGFESVPKASEEANTDFSPTGFSKAIYLGLSAGVLFYVLVICVVSGLAPWQTLLGERYGTAVAFNRAFNSPIFGQIIVIAAVFSLLKIFNANFLVASRLIYALGKSGKLPRQLGAIHDVFQTPHNAVIFCGIITIIGAFFGDSILIPITEVGSLCSAFGWMMTCLAFALWKKNSAQSWIAWLGMLIAATFLAMKLVPMVPGSFRRWEYLALSVWLILGFALRFVVSRTSRPHALS
ncbi:MAG TPA: APC family permease, partial [Acidobacteriota bacterium]|nr:APC family permease [Acidobacteriota bacterium]